MQMLHSGVRGGGLPAPPTDAAAGGGGVGCGGSGSGDGVGGVGCGGCGGGAAALFLSLFSYPHSFASAYTLCSYPHLSHS